jgi:archaellum component FlaC
MEKDVDEVGKIARSIKSKLEELDKEVGQLLLLFPIDLQHFNNICFMLSRIYLIGRSRDVVKEQV